LPKNGCIALACFIRPNSWNFFALPLLQRSGCATGSRLKRQAFQHQLHLPLYKPSTLALLSLLEVAMQRLHNLELFDFEEPWFRESSAIQMCFSTILLWTFDAGKISVTALTTILAFCTRAHPKTELKLVTERWLSSCGRRAEVH
jgi:hypothetical protein